MLAYVVRRVAAGLALLLVMTVVTFGIFFASPTDPARLTCGKSCTPTIIAANRHFLGFDKPIYVQYGLFMKGLVSERNFPDDKLIEKNNPGSVVRCNAPCLGYSPLQNTQVLKLINEKLPVSISVALLAFIFWIFFGVLGGILAAVFRARWPDRFLVGLSLIGYSFPTFFIGLTLYTYLAINYQVFPQPAYIPFSSDPLGWFRGLSLPAVTLSLVYISGYIRLTRAYVLETMGEDYLRTARAKGLSERKIMFKHTLRAALTPITTIAGLDLGALLAGAAITETVFNLDGFGRLAVTSASTFDLPTSVGIVLVSATFVIVANILVDVLYAVIDPRVRY